MARKRRVKSKKRQSSVTKVSSRTGTSGSIKENEQYSGVNRNKLTKPAMEFSITRDKGKPIKRKGVVFDTIDESGEGVPKTKYVKDNNACDDVAEKSIQIKQIVKSRLKPGRKKKIARRYYSATKENTINKASEVKVTLTMKENESCIEVECGSNVAWLYLSKLHTGSKGSCIYFKDSWLTPNEFQNVSGRQVAKDWKRSIRHNGICMKLLLAQKLIKPAPEQDPAPPYTEKTSDAATPQPQVTSEKGNRNIVETQTSQEILTQTNAEQTKISEGDFASIEPSTPVTEIADGKTNETDESHEKDVKEENIENEGSTPAETKLDDNNTCIRSEGSTRYRDKENEKFINDTTLPSSNEMEHKAEDENEAEMSSQIVSKADKVHNASMGSNMRTDTLENKDTWKNHPSRKTDSSVISLCERYIQNPSINIYPSAVTPPPTPPSESPKVNVTRQYDQAVEDSNMKFNSSFHQLGKESKLTLDKQLLCESYTVTDRKTETIQFKNGKDHNKCEAVYIDENTCKTILEKEKVTDVDEKQLQTFLLKDALQCAKRYKEKLQSDRTLKNYKIKSDDLHTADSFNRQYKSNSCLKHYKPSQEDVEYLSVRNEDSVHTSHCGSIDKRSDTLDRFITDTGSNLSPSYMSSFDSLMQQSRFMLQLAAMQRYSPEYSWFQSFPFTQPFHYLYPSSMIRPNLTDTQRLMALSSPLMKLDYETIQTYHDNKLPPIPIPAVPDISSRRNQFKVSSYPASVSDSDSSNKRKYQEVDCALDLSNKLERRDRKSERASIVNNNTPIDFSIKGNVFHAGEVKQEKLSTYSSTDVECLRRKHAEARLTLDSDNFPRVPRSGCSDMKYWTVDDVCLFVGSVDGCAKYTNIFKAQGITGRILPYLTSQHLTRILGMKLTPALTLMQEVDKIVKHCSTQQISFCHKRQHMEMSSPLS